MKVRSYKDLNVWQRAVDLSVEVYNLTEQFPKEEKFGLSIQMRRSAVSIPSNIAEGYGRFSSKEYRRFLSIAFGSCAELETQLIIAKQLNRMVDLSYDQVDDLLEQTIKMLFSLIKALKY